MPINELLMLACGLWLGALIGYIYGTWRAFRIIGTRTAMKPK
jgi:hypothetical protein